MNSVFSGVIKSAITFAVRRCRKDGPSAKNICHGDSLDLRCGTNLKEKRPSGNTTTVTAWSTQGGVAEEDCDQTCLHDEVLQALAAVARGTALDFTKRKEEVVVAVNGAIRAARQAGIGYSKADTSERRRTLREAMNDSGQGRAAFFRHLRADQPRPTSVLRINGALTSNMKDIHGAFVDGWQRSTTA